MPLNTLLRALGAASILAAAVAPAAALEATASYVLTLSGTNIATVAVKFDDDGRRWALDLDASVAGLAQIVASGTASINSAGQSTANRLISESFGLHTRANGEDFDVRVEYADANVSSFIVTPPVLNNYDRVPIERSHLRNVTDMLSAFIIKGGRLDETLCRHEAQIFTGMERFDIEMRFASADTATSPRTGYQGPVILCNVRYLPISGHFTTSEITTYLADSDRILVWYAPLGDTGYFIPYRVLLTTNMGDLSMVLTSMRS